MSRQDLEIQRLVAEGDETAVKLGGLGLNCSFRSLITNSLQGSNPAMCAIAIEALDRSISFIVNFGSWIDRAFE
jgi:hypothetical protein